MSEKRRSARQLAGRKRASIYYEPDTDDEFAEGSDGDHGSLPETQHRRKRQRNKPQTRSKANSRREKGGRPRKSKPVKKPTKMKAIGAPLKKRERKSTTFDGPTDGKIPDWPKLPIDILRDIFVLAAQPIHEQTTTASANVTWLMRTARRVCKAFSDPALEAYYQSPYCFDNLQPHHLLELMQMPLEKTYINYKVKVRRLEIDVRKIAYSATGKSRVDLAELIRHLPQLQHFEIIHPVDTPPYRHLKLQQWRYPTDLFDALEESDTRLKTWRWNRDMIANIAEDFDLYTFIRKVHLNKSFQRLERLVACGFDVNDSSGLPSSDVEPGPRQHHLADAVSLLPDLKDLTFISCDLVLEQFLEHLPKNLERLELSNCLEVTSDMLRKYLMTGGSQLKELVLNHDPALDLGFLPNLKTLCPNLQVLKMDLTYYSEHYNFNDAWAMYDHLLTEDEVPEWPSTLRHLELVNLQKWTAEAAQNLFRSLVESAKDLPDLRHLVIQAHINIPWRDRTGFRDQWIVRLGRVYQRKSKDPFPFLGSFKQYRIWKEEQPVEVDEKATLRQLEHVRVTPREVQSDAEAYDEDSEAPAYPSTRPQPQRRSTRVRQLQESRSASEALDVASPSTSDSESDSEDSSPKEEDFIQGLCTTVDIRIDNQRPRESQYTEANFLDSEPSGDEDWHEGAELEDDGGYAW